MSGRRNRARWEATRQKYKDLLDQHHSVAAVAQILNRSRQAVWSALRTHGLQGYKAQRRVITDISLVVNLVFCQNKTYAEVAAQLGCKKAYITEIMSRVNDQAKQLMDKNLRDTYAANIRNFRSLRGMTQEDLAKKSRVHQSGLSSIENGTRGVTNKTLSRIADALQIDLKTLLSPFSYEEAIHGQTRSPQSV